MDWLYEKMKKIVITIVAVLLLADALTGCSSKTDISQDETATATVDVTEGEAVVEADTPGVTDTPDEQTSSKTMSVVLSADAPDVTDTSGEVTEEKADRETLDVAGTKTTETAKAEVKTTEQTAKAENKTTTEQTATAKTDSIKTDTTAKTTNTSADTSSDNGGKKQTATTKPVQAASTGTTESTETATTEATTEKKKIWHEPVYETVETKTPVYEYFPVTVQKDCCVCWDCGAILYTQDDLNNHFNADHPGNGYYSSTYTVETGEYTYDVAYYEYSTETVLVSEGYWEYID